MSSDTSVAAGTWCLRANAGTRRRAIIDKLTCTRCLVAVVITDQMYQMCTTYASSKVPENGVGGLSVKSIRPSKSRALRDDWPSAGGLPEYRDGEVVPPQERPHVDDGKESGEPRHSDQYKRPVRSRHLVQPQ